MNVSVKLMGLPKKFLGEKLNVTLSEDAKVKDLLDTLNGLLKENGVVNQFTFDPVGLVILVNGTEISALKRENTKLKDSDNIAIIPIIHGG